MEHRWTARGGVFALALLAGLAACTDQPVAPAAEPRTAEIETSGFSAGEVFLAVSGGAASTCGATLDGSVYCWGDNTSGQLGTGDTDGRTTPVRVAGVPSARSVSVGAAHTCAATRNGDVYCWGDNSVGQLGDGTTNGSMTPVRVQRPGGTSFVSVTAGAIHTCALDNRGKSWCWGDGSLGQLGNGAGTGSSVPARVTQPGGVRFISVTSGDGAAHTCAVSSTLKAYCWGDNSYGQLGNGTTVASGVPVQVQSGSVRMASVSGSGFAHTCAISSTGRAYCWGDNSQGQLGDGTNTARLVPTLVSSDRRYVSVEAGWFHTCASAFLSGSLCWGDNNAGKLGNGTTNVPSSTPVVVTNSQGFGRMDPGADHSCTVRLDGKAFCWGQGFAGQLGDGNAADSSVPVQVASPNASSSSLNRAGDESRPAARDGKDAWCRARVDRGSIAACA